MAFCKSLVLLALVGSAVCLPSYGYAPAAAPAYKAPPKKAAAPPAYAPPAYAAPAAAPEKAYAAPALKTEETEENLPPRDYNFNYNINDEISPMTHSRVESQKDGVIRGEYKYSRPDGVLMTVTYTADDEGFHPVMKEEASAVRETGKATYSMDLPDAPEHIEVSVNKEELATYHKAEADRAYAEEYPTTKAYGYQAPAPAAPAAPAAPVAPKKPAYY